MKKAENLTHEAKQLLQPIKGRPDLIPSQDFVNELHDRIMLEGTKKKPRKRVFPLFAATAVILILPLIILSTLFEQEKSEAFVIEETSHIQLVDTIEYGDGDGEIGQYTAQGMNPVSSFDIENGTLYLLDEASFKVVIRGRDGNSTSFPIQNKQNMVGVLEDILVTQDEDIYILNSGEKVVYEYKVNGDLTNIYDFSQLDLFFPDSLYEFENNEMVVSQNQEKFASLKTLSFIKDDDLPFQLKGMNRKESRLLLNDGGKLTELSLFSDLGLGKVALQEVADEQIIYMQTVTPAVNTPISETHVFGINKEGNKLGGVLIPEENFIEKPQRMENYIKTDRNEIYLLIPERKQVVLYEVTLGQEYESFIEEQAEKVNVGFDYKTFGKPFPELEEEINKLFKNGEIQFGNEDSLNGVAIDENGTVVIDFKEFLVGSPASAEAQSLFKALQTATFDKFPEIQQIYFQFDGSFSSWVHWLESIEEPWKRQDSQY
ncbi:GerMN domain-containing protein [Cytobacillus sp. FJAT-54145]|uniref:GerMN domain-containing protein n=1 Tax=Cytobacillus spartinae TaxID=3299023 RepID=A0ABW6K8X5_9BACI